MSKNSISTNQELHQGDYLLSNNGNYKAIFQDDSNFVIYQWAHKWDTNTSGSGGYRVIMQEDGNLVIYTSSDKPVWGSDTHGDQNPRMRLALTDEGQLVVTRNGQIIWTSS
ncbi:mannose-specific lectin-like isoform X1 [Myripristis murdjan]|uniref:mannose-specific lectin-like isoform X1 n=1 Tax=Myripristis murdjan TaxID=586833 RepID=UPI001176355F|nr:mannose-specific lectin-like isoform X1 [Myripristis murdjan]